jgi:hypothetical protein
LDPLVNQAGIIQDDQMKDDEDLDAAQKKGPILKTDS